MPVLNFLRYLLIRDKPEDNKVNKKYYYHYADDSTM